MEPAKSPAVFARKASAPPSELNWSGLPFHPSEVVEGEDQKKFGIHRDVPEIEMKGSQACVRVYHCGKLKKATPFEEPKKPKIRQEGADGGQVAIDQKRADKMFWMSGGTPLRQLGWAEKNARETPGGRAVVNSFLVPLDTYNRVTARAVPEQMGGTKDAEVRNVDPTGAPNQYGIRGPAFQELLKAIVPGSLVTYAEDPSDLEGSGWGQIRRLDDLRQQLHVPPGVGLVGPLGQENIIVDEKTAKFSQSVFFTSKQPDASASKKRRSFATTADEYADILGLWIGGQDRNALLNLASHHKKSGDFEAHRDQTLKTFLARFGYTLPDNWRSLKDFGKVRYSQSAEVFERNLGIYLATHPDANHAASQMCSGLWTLFQEQKRTDVERFGRDDAGSAGSIGLDKFQLSLVPAQGNLRERLTWVLAAIRNGVAGELLVAANLRKKKIPKFHDPKKERLEEHRKEVANQELRRTTTRPLDVQHPPLSANEQKFGVSKAGALQWEPGGRSIDYKMSTPYQLQAERELRLVSAGPSGSAFAMLYVAHHLGVNLQHARLALLTWMLTVGDHTFDEIMEGCAIWAQKKAVPGLDYKDRASPRRYRSIAPLTEYELRRFVCEDEEFPDEHLTEGMISEVVRGPRAFY